MLSSWIVIVVAFGYIGLLFAIASYGDRPGRGARGRAGVLIYPLSLAIYCTSWTFFGSVGFAARTGPEFLSIYIGPVIMVGLCTPLLLRVIRLAKAQKITSIADFIAARYGKSQPVAALVALIAITGSVPYIALQLKAVATSLETLLVNDSFGGGFAPVIGDIALIVTTAMALFAVAFGTRHTDVTEHQHGLMLAVASESIVKLVAFLAVGACVTFVLFGPHELLTRAVQSPEASHVLNYTPSASSFAAMTLLSFFATLLLPRQFHVGVVENADESEVRRARWMFPLYLVAINVFVIPIALAGLIKFPFGYVDSDMYVLALPLAAGSPWLTMIAFVGGLSAATAMVIVESVALAVMVSNTLVMPLLLQRRAATSANADVGSIILKARRVAIFAVLLLSYLYYRSAGNAQLASIGLLSFAAAAQLAPAFFGGLVWRRATALGAMGGMVAGIAVWPTRSCCRASPMPGLLPPTSSATACSASRHCDRRRCSALRCNRCCTAWSGACRSTSSLTSCYRSCGRRARSSGCRPTCSARRDSRPSPRTSAAGAARSRSATWSARPANISDPSGRAPRSRSSPRIIA